MYSPIDSNFTYEISTLQYESGRSETARCLMKIAWALCMTAPLQDWYVPQIFEAHCNTNFTSKVRAQHYFPEQWVVHTFEVTYMVFLQTLYK